MRTTIYLLIICLLIAACTPAPQDTTTTPPTDSDDAQANVQEEVEATAPPAQPNQEEASVFEEFKDLFSMKMQLEYKVDYDMITKTNGETQQMSMSQYIKGDKIRSDMMFESIESRSYIDGTSIISCTKQKSWTCYEMQFEQSDMQAVEEQLEEDIDAGKEVDVTPLPSKTVAGAKTSCFRVTTEDGAVDYCLSKEGVPLYMKSSGSSDGTTYESEMTATSYSTTVSAADFTPPASPQKMPSMDDMGDFDADAYADMMAQYS